MTNSGIIFEGVYNTITFVFIFIIFLVSFGISSFILRKRIKTFILLLFLRLCVLVILLLIILKPVYIYYSVEEELLEVPVIIDKSFSQYNTTFEYDGIDHNALQERILDEHILQNDDLKGKMNVILYDTAVSKFVKNPKESQPYGITDMNSILDVFQSKSLDYKKIIILSDWYYKYQYEKQHSKSPVYFIDTNFHADDPFIREVLFNKDTETVQAVICATNEYDGEIDFTLKYDKGVLYNDMVNLTNREVIINIPASNIPVGKHILTAEITVPHPDNKKNNISYVKTDIKRKENIPTVHYLCGEPNFTTSFISRFVINNDDLNIKQYYMKPGINKIQIENIKSIDILILQNIDNSYINKISVKSKQNITKHIKAGGKTIIVSPVHNPKLLQESFFSKTPLLEKSWKNDASTKQYALKLSSNAYNENYMTFYNKTTAQQEWDRLIFFNEPNYVIKPSKSAEILATINDTPAIIKSANGNIIAFLFGGLWRMDFSNMKYGIESNYLNSMLQNILVDERTKDIQLKRIYIQKEIIEFGEQTKIEFNVDKVNTKNLKIVSSNEITDIQILENDKEMCYIFKAEQLGKHIILENGEEIGNIYVKYPQAENSKVNMDEINKLVSESGGEIISGDLQNIAESFTKTARKYEKELKIKLTNIYLFFILIILLLSIDWVIRKKYLS